MLLGIVVLTVVMYPTVHGQSVAFDQECHILQTLELLETSLQEQDSRLKLQQTHLEQQKSLLEKQNATIEKLTTRLEEQDAFLGQQNASLVEQETRLVQQQARIRELENQFTVSNQSTNGKNLHTFPNLCIHILNLLV